MHESREFFGGDDGVIILNRGIRQTSNKTLTSSKRIHQSCACEGGGCKMELRDFIHIPFRDTDDPILSNAGVADDEDVEVRIQRRRSLQPTPHLHGRGHGENSGPLAEERRAFQIIRMLYERLDPRVQLAAAVCDRRGRGSL